MENSRIPDSAITASNVYKWGPTYYTAQSSRRNFSPYGDMGIGWSVASSTGWLRVDMGSRHVVKGLTSKNKVYHSSAYIDIAYSEDAFHWVTHPHVCYRLTKYHNYATTITL